MGKKIMTCIVFWQVLNSRTYVRNLDWILRRSAEVERVEVRYNGFNGHEATFLAYGAEERRGRFTFAAQFVSMRVCAEFARRKRFAHAVVSIDSKVPSKPIGMIGSGTAPMVLTRIPNVSRDSQALPCGRCGKHHDPRFVTCQEFARS